MRGPQEQFKKPGMGAAENIEAVPLVAQAAAGT
jgi:hypothetical protein